jgi:adenylate cyclase
MFRNSSNSSARGHRRPSRATALYRGDLLDGLDVRDAGFEEWLLIERQRLRGLECDALAALLDRYMASDERQQAGAIARRLLRLDPLREAAHRALMRNCADQGQAALALKQYQLCRDALQSELGVMPEVETERLYQSIKERRASLRQLPPAQGPANTSSLLGAPTRRHDAEKAAPSARPPLAFSSSIAVLPFVDMSGNPEQEYFADGITEDIITDMSRWRTITVSSRNSTFRFKGKYVDVQRVGRELAVRFLVEGGVRRMGERVRITAQLIDAETGNHIWAERFDRPMADLSAVQDEVVRTIVGTLVGRVQMSEAERVRRERPSSLAAYDLTLRGNALSWDDPASAAEAKRVFERAIEIDPGYARPHSLLAVMLAREWRNDLSGSHDSLDRAFTLAQRAVELADDDSTCHTTLGYIYFERRCFDLALRHMERGVEINPVNPWNQVDLGYLLSYIGRAEEALEILRNARRVDPYIGPPWYWRSLGVAQFALRRYAESLADFDRGAANCPRYALAMMAGCCAKLGLSDRARELLAQCLAGHPEGTVAQLLAKIPFKYASDCEHLAECLRLAGMPERHPSAREP